MCNILLLLYNIKLITAGLFIKATLCKEKKVISESMLTLTKSLKKEINENSNKSQKTLGQNKKTQIVGEVKKEVKTLS